MKVLVTGSSGHLAQALLPKLCGHEAIERVTGIDIAAPHFSHDKLEHRHLDVRDPMLEKLWDEHDALVHLAFVVLRGKTDAATMREINVIATRRLFDAAARAGIGRRIHLSSAAVYGFGENLDEDAPFRPLPDFLYAQHKTELEHWFAINQPDTVRLRPHIILGPNCLPLFRQLLALPFHVRLPNPQPRLQCVHEDDVAEAILLSLFSDAQGPFNLAAPGTFSFKEVIRQRHRFSIPLPLPLVKACLNIASRRTGWGGEPEWVEGMRQPLTLDCTRADTKLGWKPSHPTVKVLL
jgi:nucleoside-diphosphate-sugar epimerase